MKRSNSSQDLPNRKTPRTARYVARFSLPKLQSHHRKKLKPRQKNARLSEYLEEYNDMNQDSEEYSNVASTSASSNPIDLFSPFIENDSPTKQWFGEFDRLRLELKCYGEDSRSSDSVTINSQEVNNRRNKIGPYLWLNLQTFFANRSMSISTIQHSLESQQKILTKMREEKSVILNEIVNFKILTSLDPNLSWIRAVYDQNYMRLLQENYLTVGSLLDKYDSFCCLFSSSQTMVELSSITPEIQNRILMLYAWYNNLSDLYAKIQQLGSYFEFLNDAKRKTSFATIPHTPGTTTGSSTGSSSKLDRMWPRFSTETEGEDVDMEKFDNDITKLCDSQDSLANAFASMYSTVVSRSLRLRGMLVILGRLDRICQLSVEKIWSYFKIQRYSDVVNSSPSTSKLVAEYKPKPKCRIMFSNHLVSDMNLPSFFHLFLFFIKIPVDLLNQWLQMRSEKVNTNGLDILTLNTLIEDSHDCLKMAIETKKRFINIVTTTCSNPDEQLAYLEGFDENFNLVFQNYLNYLRSWSQTIANPVHNSDVEWCEKLVKKLQKEWTLSKEWSSSVIRGECTAAKRFCDIANDLFDCVKGFKNERFDLVDQTVLENNPYDEDFIMVEDGSTINNSTVLVLCRELKQMTRNLRERALKSLHFLRTLCLDLEICSRYKWNSEYLEEVDGFVMQLLLKEHVMLLPDKISDCGFVILCNRSIVRESNYINNLLNATFSNNAIMPTAEHSTDIKGGYVILIRSSLVSQEIRDRPNRAHISLSVNTRFNLNHLSTENAVYLISDSCDKLREFRMKFEECISNYLPQHLKLVDDFCSCNDQISEELNQAKDSAFDVARELWVHASELNDYILNGRDENDLNETERDSINGTLLQAFSAAFEYYKELSKITSRPKREGFYHEIVECLVGWSDYVLRTLQVIKRSTPNWVLAPLNYFLSLPVNSFEIYLSEEDKKRFADTTRKCLAHLRDIAQKGKGNIIHKVRYSGHRLSDKIENLNLEEYYISRKTSVSDRISQANNELDNQRDEKLRNNGKIGCIAETRRRYDFANIFASRKAPFEWQRLENKLLGRGSFGSVYLVMNLRDSCLMAMKQLHVPLENNSGLKSIADEVDILRNLDHPNLIKYYGVEVHQEELMLFMEYCSEGTLARVCREGLDLACVRRYTHYLLSAISYLHDHNIVHRDVKPANIFLGQKNVLKLGDFGCSFRLHGTNTMVGELVNFVGTTVYCAPELQTCGGLQTVNGDSQSSFLYKGYGRAVDIWSAGATVLEMLTGKKPYHYLEHELQIIFQLGSGIPPRIPIEVQKCEIAYSFLTQCFKINPDERPDARTMLQHPFSNVVASIEMDSQDPHLMGFSQSTSSQSQRQRYKR